MKTSTTTIVSLFITLFISPSLASLISSPNNTCNLTPFPSFCLSILPSQYLSIDDQTIFFLQQSLTITQNNIQSISSFFNQSTFPFSTLLVLQDCLNLAELNTDFLSIVLQALETNTTMSSNQANHLQTLLSAVLTNHQTCLDGFPEVNPFPKISTTLSNSLSDVNKLYKITLQFFTLRRTQTIIARLTNQITITTNNRKLLQTSVDNVMVRQKVVVNPDGSGDFITINDAVDAAPTKTGNNGYHVIYVVAGIYSEYISIPKSKENLMIVGDGIGRTIITGNRSVVDGWTTFQSATFGKLINSSNTRHTLITFKFYSHNAYNLYAL